MVDNGADNDYDGVFDDDEVAYDKNYILLKPWCGGIFQQQKKKKKRPVRRTMVTATWDGPLGFHKQRNNKYKLHH